MKPLRKAKKMLKHEVHVSYEMALDLWEVDIATGTVKWRTRRNPAIPHDRSSNTLDKHGYKKLSFRKKIYYHHRIVWLFANKNWPEIFIDHINGLPTDNRIENLREATSYQNQQNRRKKAKRVTQSMGVYFDPKRKKFVPQIRVEGKAIFLGRYETEEEASKIYLEAKLKFHPHANLERCK